MMIFRIAAKYNPVCLRIEIAIYLQISLILIDSNPVQPDDVTHSEYLRHIIAIPGEELQGLVIHAAKLIHLLSFHVQSVVYEFNGRVEHVLHVGCSRIHYHSIYVILIGLTKSKGCQISVHILNLNK